MPTTSILGLWAFYHDGHCARLRACAVHRYEDEQLEIPSRLSRGFEDGSWLAHALQDSNTRARAWVSM